MGKVKQWFSNIVRPVDLTSGVPWKVILRYSAPIILSYLLQQLYVLSDAIICGQVLSAEEVAGVNDTFPLTFIFLQFAFGCTAGFSVITAKCVGAGDADGARHSFVAQIILSAIISVVLSVIAVIFLPNLLGIINVTPANKTVYDAAYIYCLIIFVGIITQMGYNFICGILRAYGDSVTPLVFLIISTALNVALDIFFLTVLKMGAAGAALATVLTQLLSVIGCYIFTVSKYKQLRPRKGDAKYAVKEFAAHLKQGLPLGLQFAILAIGIIVMQSVVVKFDLLPDGTMVSGTPAQNGYGAASKLINFLMSAFNGLGAAILGFNAQNLGKGNYETIRKGTVQTLIITVITSAICLALGLLLSINGAYQYIFMSVEKISEKSIEYGNIALIVDVGLYVILGFLIVTRSAVQGVCATGYVLGAGIAELTARSLICSFLPVIVNGGAINSSASSLAFAALCFGDPGAWTLASLVLCVPFINRILKMNYPVASVKKVGKR